MQISLGFSTCPNDTFMFDAMVNQRIDTQGYSFDTKMADIKELNDLAFKKKLDVTKLSYHAYAYLREEYMLLDSGSALGFNCGPLLISKDPIHPNTVSNKSVAIPGKYTTANLLFSLAYPEDKCPIPLGGIVAKRSLGQKKIKEISQMLSRSVQHAFNNPTDSADFVLRHAQEMQPEVVKQHISLYVNQYSVSLGETGRSAVQKLFEVGAEKGVLKDSNLTIFINGV